MVVDDAREGVERRPESDVLYADLRGRSVQICPARDTSNGTAESEK